MTRLKVRRIDMYPDDWIAGVVRLSDAERGVYIQVLMGIYSHGGPIELEDARALCGRQFNASINRLVALGKLTLTEQKDDSNPAATRQLLDNKRAATELQRSSNRAAIAQQNGSMGGRHSYENNGLAKPGGFFEPRARARTTHQSSTNNHQPSNARDSQNGKWKKAQPPLDRIPGHFDGCRCPGCERLAELAVAYRQAEAMAEPQQPEATPNRP